MTIQAQIQHFQETHPGQTYALYLSKAQIHQLLNEIDNCDGIRIYLGLDSNQKIQGYANACIGQNDYFPEALLSTSRVKALPCPTFCSK